MLPHEHLIVAALPVLSYILLRHRRFPSKAMIFVVFVGSQFPDLVDKPLAYSLMIIPSGRVFLHSLPFAIPISIFVMIYGIETNRPALSSGFVYAYLSHILVDVRQSLFAGQLPQNLLWPFVDTLPASSVPPWAGSGNINVTLWITFSVLVLSGTAIIILRDILFQLSNEKI